MTSRVRIAFACLAVDLAAVLVACVVAYLLRFEVLFDHGARVGTGSRLVGPRRDRRDAGRVRLARALQAGGVRLSTASRLDAGEGLRLRLPVHGAGRLPAQVAQRAGVALHRGDDVRAGVRGGGAGPAGRALAAGASRGAPAAPAHPRDRPRRRDRAAHPAPQRPQGLQLVAARRSRARDRRVRAGLRGRRGARAHPRRAAQRLRRRRQPAAPGRARAGRHGQAARRRGVRRLPPAGAARQHGPAGRPLRPAGDARAQPARRPRGAVRQARVRRARLGRRADLPVAGAAGDRPGRQAVVVRTGAAHADARGPARASLPLLQVPLDAPGGAGGRGRPPQGVRAAPTSTATTRPTSWSATS